MVGGLGWCCPEGVWENPSDLGRNKQKSPWSFLGDNNSLTKFPAGALSQSTIWNVILETVLICSCSETCLMHCKDLFNSSDGSVSTSKQIIPLKSSGFYLFLSTEFYFVSYYLIVH